MISKSNLPNTVASYLVIYYWSTVTVTSDCDILVIQELLIDDPSDSTNFHEKILVSSIYNIQ